MANVLFRDGFVVNGYEFYTDYEICSSPIIRLTLANNRQINCSIGNCRDQGLYALELVKAASFQEHEEMVACLDEKIQIVSLWVSPRQAELLKAAFR